MKSPGGGRSPNNTKSQSRVSPIRKTLVAQQYPQDELFNLRPSHEEKHSPQKFVGSGNLNKDEDLNVKRSRSATKEAETRKTASAANNRSNLHESQLEARELRETKENNIRMPLGVRDANEQSSALTAKFKEEHAQENKHLHVPKTLEGTVDILSSQRKSLNEQFIDKPKQIGRQNMNDKENASFSPSRNKSEVMIIFS